MTQRAYAAIAILVSSLVLGIAGDSFLRVSPWGPNLAAWLGIALVAAAIIGWRYRLETLGNVGLAAVPIALFATGLALRDSATLRFLNILGILSVLGMAFMKTKLRMMVAARVSDCVAVWFGQLFIALGRFFLLFGQDVPWKSLGDPEKAREYRAAAVGVSVALPLLLIFGGLFISADAVFKSLTVDQIQLDSERILTAICLIPLFAWVGGAVLRQLLIGEPESPPIVKPEGYRIGKIEIGIIMGSVVTLFLAFVIVQIGYLFGGDARVQNVAGLTYAEYARSGFFELTAAAAIAIVVILSLQSLLSKEDKPGQKLFLVLGGAFIVELFVVLASASQRMYIYIRAYGLSELRFFIAAAILWMFVVLIWLLITSMARKSQLFAFGALASLYATVWVCTAINPDKQIADFNLSMNRTIDVSYLSELGCDAAPSVLARLQALPKDKQREAAYYLLHDLAPDANEDWRTLNLGRRRAAEQLASNKAVLQKMAKGFEPIEECGD